MWHCAFTTGSTSGMAIGFLIYSADGHHRIHDVRHLEFVEARHRRRLVRLVRIGSMLCISCGASSEALSRCVC